VKYMNIEVVGNGPVPKLGDAWINGYRVREVFWISHTRAVVTLISIE